MVTRKEREEIVKSSEMDTKVVHAGQFPDEVSGAITTPIYQTATYVLDEIGKDKGYQYSRTNNPTRTVLEKLVAELEGSRYGIAFATGMAAADAIVRAVLKAGDHVVVGDDVYGGIYRLFEKNYTKFGLSFTYVDTTNPSNVKKAINDDTRMVWLETPTNPLLKVSDVRAIAKIVQEENERRIPSVDYTEPVKSEEELLAREQLDRRILTVVDNTFYTPIFLRPLAEGVDVVLHSTTKYLSGHNQLVGGMVVVRDDPTRWYYKPRPIRDEFGRIMTDDQEYLKTEIVNTLHEDIRFIQNAVGAVPGPFDCWLAVMGIKTLDLRMKKHDENANKIVAFLKNHPKVKKVNYPGNSGMISFELNADLDAAIKVMNSVKLWSLAESLGAVDSMITHPATMTHASVPPEERQKRGITDGLIRLSVGIENPKDLIDDLKQALDNI